MILALTPYKVISHDLWCLRARWFCLFRLEQGSLRLQIARSYDRVAAGAWI
ncbi:hypothetical protein ALQ11_02550 [Pseudomonas savastanoi pv. glycinea]|uniref:Uncharacterized protein n=1 Tax=Pseudomonas savastanoi pv. glycinea TaxID=318 RepID=A0AB74B002_PSESG|nr:hypothetical protein ALQ11_02550 [Pseudomonas savastanoi pv. glycinea]